MTHNDGPYIPSAQVGMLIRKPVSQVFEAFIDPTLTTQFWFTKSSGRLETGRKIQWDWEMYNHTIQVDVKDIEEYKRILIEWTGYQEPTPVEWRFDPLTKDTTFVHITNKGFRGSKEEIFKQALSSTEGFTLVLSGLKAFLEHNLILNLVRDRFPKILD